MHEPIEKNKVIMFKYTGCTDLSNSRRFDRKFITELELPQNLSTKATPQDITCEVIEVDVDEKVEMWC